ncbi:MAG: T9SS type A sorting domain-containing protein [Cyclobacteriaceae bacterium]|nr:T9SS type A sorting domain-containing protein [Cyclobacteriaceae bacterium]MDH5250224.1 T9SS type A sorting domain-containing protein [Cyclobacteriaceae bacterium]
MKFSWVLVFCFSFCVIILITVSTERRKVYQSRESTAETFSAEEEGEEETDNPLEFFRFQQEIRTRDNENGPGYEVGYRSKALSLARNGVQARRASVQSNGVIAWTERGPGNVPGRTRALLNIPQTNNNTWLAGAATGGIWKTVDGGTSWQERNENLTALPISAFAADATGSVIYAATGELISSAYSAMGDGIFKSVDKGETWTPIIATQGNPDFAVITRLIVDPNNANVIVATTAPPSSDREATKSSIMRSANGGITWTKVKEITGVFDQIISTPGNFEIQYAAQNGVGVWKSVDGGLTWSLSNAGMSISGRVELAVSAVNPDRLFASAEGELSGVESDLYVSSDAGVTWSLVKVLFNNNVVDFLGNSATEPDSQGFYDNTILCDPFDEHIVYFGGVNLFRSTLGAETSETVYYSIDESTTVNFMSLINFSASAVQGRVNVGQDAGKIAVEIRFGPGKTQKAHRFLVPEGSSSGVPDGDYTYQGFADVPFEVWDVTNGRQLMVSFRDQGRDGKFNLTEASTSGLPAESQSREYIFVNNVDYNNSPDPNIVAAGGHLHKLMYNIWPVLVGGGAWPPSVNSTLKINTSSITRISAATITVADGYGNYDSKNIMSQDNLQSGVHVDHHTMVPVIADANKKTYKVLLGNDGGVFVSNTGTTPGTEQGGWQFKGFGYNTSQFYGADKKPGEDRFIGGMQDNGTRISPVAISASAKVHYTYAIGGDGFETIWNNLDESKILGSIYYGQIYRSNDSGRTWSATTTGLGAEGFPFITKLGNNKDLPNRVFTVSAEGVYVSGNFGNTWTLTPIPDNFVGTSYSSLDVEVSRANGNIVWAGSGMSNNSGIGRKLFVSTDGGASFKSTNNFNNAVLGSITKLASHPTEPNTAYVLFSFARGPKILRTKNLGQTWEDISGFHAGSTSANGFPDVAVYSLYVRPDNPAIIWAGTEIGIVESQDDGVSWSLLEDFPKVSVWDMKGQDDQVVIATHGRGIWTATIDQPQSNNYYSPEIITTGTAPDKALVLRITSEKTFDSLYVYVDESLTKRLQAIEIGVTDIVLTDVPSGIRSIYFVSFTGSAPYQSKIYTIDQLDILALKDNYSTYFGQLTDLTLTNLSLQNFSNLPPSTRKTLQTIHPYSSNNNYAVLFRTPVKINSTFPTLYYADVAIVEPDKDSVVIEATKNGIDWISLSPSYNASKDASWQLAYTNNQPGLSSMFVQHEVDISKVFSAGDSLLFRLRMTSGISSPGWGWAIDFISIQQAPLSILETVGAHPITVYPNPSTGRINITYDLNKSAEVTVEIIDLFGRITATTTVGQRDAGAHTDHLDLENNPAAGTYIIKLIANGKSSIAKFIIKN